MKECTCSQNAIRMYQKKISGPIIDRIDLFVDVPPVEIEQLTSARSGELSSVVRARVMHARIRQRERLGTRGFFTNSEILPQDIETMCVLTVPARQLLETAAQKMDLSARSYSRILKVARTIADLDESETIDTHHIAESVQYRPAI